MIADNSSLSLLVNFDMESIALSVSKTMNRGAMGPWSNERHLVFSRRFAELSPESLRRLCVRGLDQKPQVVGIRPVLADDFVHVLGPYSSLSGIGGQTCLVEIHKAAALRGDFRHERFAGVCNRRIRP